MTIGLISSKLDPDIEAVLATRSVFSAAVLRATAAIPVGSTATYAEIARAIGRPGAVRAVGTALAHNPLAPRIPCHRVIRSDGQLGNYSGSGGVAAKAALLAAEREALAGAAEGRPLLATERRIHPVPPTRSNSSSDREFSGPH